MKISAFGFIFFSLLSNAFSATQKDVSLPSFSSFKSAYSAGNSALKKGQYKEAQRDYLAAEGLASSAKGRSDAYNAAGWALMKGKKWVEAKSILLEAVTEDKSNQLALKNLGCVCFNLYAYGFAGLDELKNAVQYLGDSGENEELLDRAKNDLEREQGYTQSTPGPEPTLRDKSQKALLAMADEAQAQGQNALALRILKRAALTATSISAKSLVANRQGKLLLDDRKPHEALLCFQEAIKGKPKDKVYLNNLAYAYWTVYDSGKGTIEDLKKAVDIYYRVNSMDSTFHNEMFKMALEELKEVDPATAGQYTSVDETADGKPMDPKGPGDDGDR
jgi:tetratricopeptide (TPR) repeat protein